MCLRFLCLSPLSAVAAEPIVYERDIAPIFRTYCAGCHNDIDLEGDLSFERFATLRKGGSEEGDPILPGKPDESFLIRSLEGKATPKMPPKDEPRVPAAELALLKRWITEGAKGPARDDSILETLVVPEIAGAKGQKPAVTALAFSPDGKQLAVGSYGRVELRDAAGRRVRREIAGLPGKVNAMNFSPDGKQVVAATGINGLRGVAQLVDVRRGKLVREFAGHRDVLYDAEFSPDGQLLATAGYDRTIRIWRTENGEVLHTIAVHNGAVFDLAFDPSGTVLASASADQTVKLWRVSDGTRLDTLSQPQGELYRVAFTRDGQHILAAGADKRLHFWLFVSREKPESNPVVESRFAHESGLTTFALSGNGDYLITAAADRTLKLWSLPDLVERHAYGTQSDMVSAIASAPNGKSFVAGRMDGSIETYKIWVEREPAVAVVAKASPASLNVATNFAEVVEAEPNDLPAAAQAISLPVEIKGAVAHAGDRDVFRFRARAGEELTLAINAGRVGSKLDSRIEVLFADGRPVEQVVLQAVRDSWFTFRGKDSETSDDFRLHNWAEMELNEYLYANGEVVRLWLYPRGPDSGFKVYPGAGKRQTAFGTTALTHALNAPCYIVTPHPAGSQPVPNGLPVFRLNYENDDDPSRRWDVDSQLLFTAPKDGEYLARLTDVRGFGGETNFQYSLTIRERRPDFSVAVEGLNPKVGPGSGKELRFTATRMEGFEGPIRIDIANLPAGFSASTPIEIEAGQEVAIATLHAMPGSVAPDEVADQAVKLVTTASIGGREVVHEIGSLGDLQLGEAPKVTVAILPGNDPSVVQETPGQPLEFTIRPGQTIAAKVRAERRDFAGRIELGNEDSGRNLPHGVFVDNIGLNGLLIVEGQTEREFFITAAPIAQPGTRRFHLRTTADGNQASLPVILHLLPASSVATERAALMR